MNLFNEAEKEENPAAAQAEEMDAALPAKKRKSRTSNAERFKDIPVTREYLDLPEEDRVCPVCNTPLVKIGEEFVRRELVFIPAKVKVLNTTVSTIPVQNAANMISLSSKKEKMADHICFMAWHLPERLHG